MDVSAPVELLARAAAIRLPLQHLAAAAGKHPNTVKKLPRREGREHRATVEAIDRALTGEEQKVLRHLLGRFGKPELYDQIVPAPSGEASRTALDDASQKAAAA